MKEEDELNLKVQDNIIINTNISEDKTNLTKELELNFESELNNLLQIHLKENEEYFYLIEKHIGGGSYGAVYKA